VIGAGHIGLHVIRMAKGFGMNVKAFDVKQNPFLAEVLEFKYATLDEILKTADILTLHAPYNTKTHHMINLSNIDKIKRGAILINTARGALVETDALLRALESGILAGAGLDVLEGEELIKEEKQLLSHKYPLDKMETLLKSNILLHRDDVVFTPHIAFYSNEALQRILDTTVSTIKNFHEGQIINSVAMAKP
jgi:D-lactate dehydrogenase